MESDFGRSAAMLSEGRCPLCRSAIMVSWCPGCRVGWNLSRLEDGRPLITADRDLTDAEVKRLYATT